MAKIPARTPTIEQARREYAVHCRSAGMSERTVEWHDLSIMHFARFMEEELHLAPTITHVTVENAEHWIISLQKRQAFVDHPYIATQKRGLSSYTVNDYVRAVRAFSHFLQERKYAKYWELQGLKPPKVDQVMKPVVSGDVLAAVFKLFSPPNCYLRARNTAMLALIIDCGLRSGELRGLKQRDVDMERGVAKVFGKGRKERWVGVSDQSLVAVNAYLRFRPDTAAEELFVSPRGEPLNQTALASLFVRIKRKLGLEKFHPHLPRHVSATMRHEGGQELLTLQRQLGHTSPDVTIKYIGAVPWHEIEEHRKHSPLARLNLRLPKPRRRG